MQSTLVYHRSSHPKASTFSFHAMNIISRCHFKIGAELLLASGDLGALLMYDVNYAAWHLLGY